MEEAVEICKLRLFLKLVAQLESYDQIEPLPDIDFNIRAGNTLVDFTSLEAVRQAMTIKPNGQRRQVFPEDKSALDRINEEAEIASAAFNQFRWQQTMLGGEVTSTDKQALCERLRTLDDELDRYLASEYGINPAEPAEHNKGAAKLPKCDKLPGKHNAYQCWLTSHQPFHWFVEFYGIMRKGGFDVVIGNPPFVEYRKILNEYRITGLKTLGCGNLCYFLCERALILLNQHGYWSLIMPVAAISSDRTATLRALLTKGFVCWISSFSNRPSKLFDGVEQRIAIFISKKNHERSLSVYYSSDFYHWYSDERSALFACLSYLQITIPKQSGSIPKVGTSSHGSVLIKLKSMNGVLARVFSPTQKSNHVTYFHNGPTYWVRATNFNPNLTDGSQQSSHYVAVGVQDERAASTVACILNSSLFYLYFKSYSNCRDLTMREIENFPLPELPSEATAELQRLSDELMRGYKSGRSQQSRTYPSGYVEYYEYYPHQLKAIIDRVDGVLAPLYDFTSDELECIVEYKAKYR